MCINAVNSGTPSSTPAATASTTSFRSTDDAATGVDRLAVQSTGFDREPVDAGGGSMDQMRVTAMQAQQSQQLLPATSSTTLDGPQLIDLLDRAAAQGTLVADQQALLEKLRPLANTIDASEAESVLELVRDANTRGEMSAARLAKVVVQIDGSAAGLPKQYLDAAIQAQDMLVQSEDESRQIMQHALTSSGGAIDETLLTQLDELAQQRLQIQEALRGNFDRAKQDPAAALAQLQAGLAA